MTPSTPRSESAQTIRQCGVSREHNTLHELLQPYTQLERLQNQQLHIGPRQTEC